MKKYICDGGTIMIGTKESRVCFPNAYGDGCFYVNVIKTEKERRIFEKKNWKWLGAVEGTKFYVWNYDCLTEDELVKENILYTLSGRYAVYNNNGEIALVKWL